MSLSAAELAEDNSQIIVLPVGMRNSALVLQDEAGNSIPHELENITRSETNITPTAINIENSSDVVIGPVTHFNGPVTICQNVNGSPKNDNAPKKYLNGKLVKSDSTSSETSCPTEKTNKNFWCRSTQLKYICISLILLAIIVIITVAAILSVQSQVSPPAPPPSHPDGVDEDRTGMNNKLKPAGPGTIIEKKNWGGRPALNFTVQLQHPTHFVIISHTATPFCNTFVTCSARAKSIQDYHVGIGSPDIGYNFLVGGDGNVYVGRGWDIRNFHSGDSIGISFIGNYLYDSLTPAMINMAKKLIKIGVEKGKIAEDYKLIGHNQTFATQSPGPRVYEVIKTWPHFDPNSFLRT